MASLGHIYGLIGREKEAREILNELSTRAGQENISAYQLALVHIGLGETEPAMEALQRADREHSTLLNYVKMDPRFDRLRGNPQFQDLLQRMNFPQ